MKIYGYVVFPKDDFSNIIFVKVANRNNAIKRAWKEWFNQTDYYKFLKQKDLRAIRVTK
jgi:hypothetical protein